MTDSRPEITAKDRGQFVVLTLRRTDSCGVETFEEVPLSVEEAYDLAVKLVDAKALAIVARNTAALAATEDVYDAIDSAKPGNMIHLGAPLERKSWRDREPML